MELGEIHDRLVDILRGVELDYPDRRRKWYLALKKLIEEIEVSEARL